MVAIEVKWGLGDLLQSFGVVGEHAGPRLAVEVNKMLEVCDVPILIVPTLKDRGDGVIADSYSQWRYASAKGILSSIALYGVLVDEWDGDIAQRIAQWWWVMQKEEHDWAKQGGRPRFIALDKTYVAAVWTLCSARGVGPETAKKLLGRLGTVGKVMEMAGKSPESLVQFGANKKAAGSLFDLVTKKW